ncbi:MAG: hypothetical protein HC867_06695 [Bacteroidia bacterium]|nr:hypothetical protein [Bacteroidia bacterium]
MTKLAEAETFLCPSYCFIFASLSTLIKMEITIIKAVLAVIFASAFFVKIKGKSKLVFEQAGYAMEVMYAIGVAELILAVALFTKYELLATIGLLGIMGGALFTLIKLKEKPSHYILSIVTITLLLVLLWLQLSTSGIIQA